MEFVTLKPTMTKCIKYFFSLLFLYCFRKKRLHPQKTSLVCVTIINNFKIKILSMQLKKQQFADTQLALVETDTQAPIAATFSEIEITSEDTSIVSIGDVNADGILDVIGVAPGTTNITVKAKASYFDTNLGKDNVVDKSKSVSVTVSAPPPEAQSTELLVTFTDPADVPTEAPAAGL